MDLNLLMPLRALLEERHVSHAAERVGLSQPAMSQALKRLRSQLDDELLVRGSAGYQLTPRAEQLLEELRELLPRLDALVAAPTFDPASAEEAFRIACTDYAIHLFGAELFRSILRFSPQSTLHVEPWHNRVLDDVEQGSLDLVFYAVPPPPTLRSERLFDERYICAVSAEHPFADHPRISLDAYLTSRHVVVSTSNQRDAVIDRRLEELGEVRRANLTVPFYDAAALAVIDTPLLATLPARLANSRLNHSGLRLVPAPREIEQLDYFMAWHPRLHQDPAQEWLRNRVRTAVATIASSP
jgi:DNA-binding transcriptional LysR family regulator